MRALADWLGIRFEAKLAEPTFNRIPTRANSSFQVNRPGVLPEALDNWRGVLSDEDAKTIDARTRDLYESCPRAGCVEPRPRSLARSVTRPRSAVGILRRVLVTRDFVFVHIPKTGGSFIQAAIAEHLPVIDHAAEIDGAGLVAHALQQPALEMAPVAGVLRDPQSVGVVRVVVPLPDGARTARERGRPVGQASRLGGSHARWQGRLQGGRHPRLHGRLRPSSHARHAGAGARLLLGPRSGRSPGRRWTAPTSRC